MTIRRKTFEIRKPFEIGAKVAIQNSFVPEWNGLTGKVREVGDWVAGIGYAIVVDLDSPADLPSGKKSSRLTCAASSLVAL